MRTSTRPAAVVFGGRLHVFFRGECGTNTLYAVSTANGREWSDPVNLTEATRGARTAGQPFPVVFGDRLVVVTRDPANSRIGVCRSADGVNWSAYETVAGTENEEHPVAVVHDSRLFVFSHGHGGMVCAVSCSPDGAWGGHEVLPRTAHWPPVPVSMGDRLVLLVRDYLDPRALVATDIETATVTPVAQVTRTPAVVARDRGVTVVYRSDGGFGSVDLLGADAWGGQVVGDCDDLTTVRYREHRLVCRPLPGRPRVQVVGPRTFSFPTGDRGPRRCGGGQVIGDYLAVAVGDDVEGVVRFFDLRPLARSAAPVAAPAVVDAPGRAVAAGVTAISSGADRRYVLAVHDGRAVSIMESTPVPLWSPECRFTTLFSAPHREPGGLALLTDAAGEVHLLCGTGERRRDLRVDFAGERLRECGYGVRIPDQYRVERRSLSRRD
ncbi:hypothetical protein [Actinokineospora sp. UTMC 2448]|uniref:hypothetical protein n=1 Tax=Actinokineospora sp. UTMC 2448 TaxID=2268449 RepID=UPI002164BF3A|nr:hypothetical protein [Actinokineospora sp. UTMC 2448]